ncbi:IS1 family transposase [Microcoleus sp. LEGE 07076]|nr:IS1 family transposase [Microcoleus sp. LEGE 07076]
MFITLKSFQKLVPGDKLQTYVKKTDKICRATAVDHFQPGFLGWVLGARSAQTFEPLWDKVSLEKCYFYVTDGWSIYPMFIFDWYRIISQTYMTRVEGENTRLRYYASPARSSDSL